MVELYTGSTSLIAGAAGLSLVLFALYTFFSKSEKDHKVVANNANTDLLTIKDLDIRRTRAVASAKATDHYGEVITRRTAQYNLDSTIFGNMRGVLTRMIHKNKFGNTLYWSEAAIAQYLVLHSKIPRAPKHADPLMSLIYNECDFGIGHADGSFMDHLQFCYEYSAANYKQQSPVVLFLHSILGTGTNFFPMDKKKIPLLEGLLSDFEMRHVEAFPSFIRLIVTEKFLDEMLAMDPKKLASLSKITFHRLIDNKELTMDAENLWIHLNYQVIHLLDFVPVSNWGAQTNDDLFQGFRYLYDLLVKANKLSCKLDFDLSSGEQSADGLPVTLGLVIDRWLPCTYKRRLGAQAMENFSTEVGHSLKYTLHFN